MFERIEAAPPDPILGLSEQFRTDPRPGKLDLTAGVYRDEAGATPVFDCVKEAELRYLDSEVTKAYHPIAGPDAFGAQVEGLVFGASGVEGGRLRTSQTPGGTGALAVVARLLASTLGPRRVWLPEPTWANHDPLFHAAGHELARYRYYSFEGRRLDPGAMFADLSGAEPGDAVLVHGCCHNPTGRDLGSDQWRELADLLAERDLVGIVDFAYLGMARGVVEDTEFLSPLAAGGADLLVGVSFSKNMGLYRERVGALTVVGRDSGVAEAVQSNVKRAVRTLYSNPPSFGGSVAATVLADPGLRSRWQIELTGLRDRLNSVRRALAEAVAVAGLEGFEGIDDEYGMFTLTGASDAQVRWLREERAMYLVSGGRANIAGLTDATIPHFVEALRDAREHAPA